MHEYYSSTSILVYEADIWSSDLFGREMTDHRWNTVVNEVK